MGRLAGGVAIVADVSDPRAVQEIDTDLTGVFLCTKAVLPAMLAQRYGA
jgi:NAD(P)-dependent dehydrogenase (short-subunit alcohol dehydrogenase family)